ncbi:MAG: adenine phosphoribosyltransferase [Burkholderiales bacterium]|nr:adenine phosphoribosyltransferase [Burkholderiales bacterium]
MDEASPFAEFIRARVRTVPDWPQPGVAFRDITPLLADPRTFRVLVDIFVHRYMGEEIDVVAGIDARGFILGAVIAYELNRGFVPIRKKGKLPFDTLSEEYELEYGSAAIEVHNDAIRPGSRVLLVDDLIATGGTMLAAVRLLRRLGASDIRAAVIIDLPDLGGSAALAASGVTPFAVCAFGGH